MSRLRRLYLDAAWWADGVPPLRTLKCLLGRHCPVDDSIDTAIRCAYCGKPLNG